MLKHFEADIREKTNGMKLERGNYVDVTKFKSKPIYYTDEIIVNTKMLALLNLEINLRYFKNLDYKTFNRFIMAFVSKNAFVEIFDLNDYKNLSGTYMMVFDEYSQIYIGVANDIKKRVTSHWSKQVGLDRLIFGDPQKSKISVDSFRAFDTTRIFVIQNQEPLHDEDSYIEQIPSEYCLNRTKGGKLSGGFVEAVIDRKSNFIPVNDENNELYIEIKSLQEKRIKLMNCYRDANNTIEMEDQKSSNEKKKYKLVPSILVILILSLFLVILRLTDGF